MVMLLIIVERMWMFQPNDLGSSDHSEHGVTYPVFNKSTSNNRLGNE